MGKTRWTFAVTHGTETFLSVVLAFNKEDAKAFLLGHCNSCSVCYIGESFGYYDFVV